MIELEHDPIEDDLEGVDCCVLIAMGLADD